MTNALIIDDNRISADTVCEMLDLLGVSAKAAYGPRDAMLALKDYRPDIVFLDVNMPGVDGFEVMSYLRRQPGMEGVPVVFVTSDDQPETAGRVRRTGALLIIIKPATIESLEMALKKAGLFNNIY
jgi:two-component system CheB/CheR fusion protein